MKGIMRAISHKLKCPYFYFQISWASFLAIARCCSVMNKRMSSHCTPTPDQQKILNISPVNASPEKKLCLLSGLTLEMCDMTMIVATPSIKKICFLEFE
jgi:hypothetical protein